MKIKGSDEFPKYFKIISTSYAFEDTINCPSPKNWPFLYDEALLFTLILLDSP